MASRACGSRLSLPNQYDTKNPASEWLSGLEFARSGLTGGTSHHEQQQRGHQENRVAIPLKNFR
jgi:hypothetical protein